MTTTIFGALRSFEKLKSAGVPEEQAKTQAGALREIIDERLVSKDFLDFRLKEPEYKLVIRLGGIMTVCTAILLAGLPIILK